MSVFIQRLLQQKKYISMLIISVMIWGFLFGFYQYHCTHSTILNFMRNLFYLNHENYINQYTLYLVESFLFIIIATYLCSSYIGSLGILIINFIKGMQLSFSLIYVSSLISMNIITIIMLIIETIIEIIYVFLLSLTCFHLSLYVSFVTFFSKQKLNIKEVINYLLSYLLISFIILMVSLCLRTYIIPMF